MPETSVVFAALQLYRQPTLAKKISRRELPHDVLVLVKIAAGDQPTIENAISATGEGAEDLKFASVFYLQNAVFSSEQDKFRALGLRPGATLEDLNNHKRWLLKWLHPDRNPNLWEQKLFHKVVRSATALEGELRSGKAHPTRPEAHRVSPHKQRRKRWLHLSKRPIAKKIPESGGQLKYFVRKIWALRGLLGAIFLIFVLIYAGIVFASPPTKSSDTLPFLPTIKKIFYL